MITIATGRKTHIYVDACRVTGKKFSFYRWRGTGEFAGRWSVTVVFFGLLVIVGSGRENEA